MRRAFAPSLLVLAIVPLLAVRGSGCSVAGCSNDGPEFRSSFLVTVLHDDKPLAGATVEISGNGAIQQLETQSDGAAAVANLAAGTYWLKVTYLEIYAGYQCFHVGQVASVQAKDKVSYEWGDLAPAVRHISGTLIESRPGTGGTPIWNLVHSVDAPIPAATLKLQNALTRAEYVTTSDENGHFSFDSVPAGTYVLHMEPKKARDGRTYDASDPLLVKLAPGATMKTLTLKRREASGGSCGGTQLEIQHEKSSA